MLDIKIGGGEELRPFVLTPVAMPARVVLNKRENVFRYVESLGEELHEWLLALFVGEDIGLIAVDTVSRGDAGSTPVNVPRIFRMGLALGAKGLVLVHNHPSRDPRPSSADMRITRMIHDAGAALDLPLLEHFIVAGSEMRAILWDGGTEGFRFHPRLPSRI